MFGKLFRRNKRKLEHIIVPESAVVSSDPFAIIQAVANFVNLARDRALLLNHEMPEPALDLYYADYYVGQVRNGGHAQVIHNASNLNTVLAHASSGLKKMGLRNCASIVRKCEAWVKENPEWVGAQDGELVQSAKLEQLDSWLYACLREGKYEERAAKWIKSLRNIRSLPDGRSNEVVDLIISTNSDYLERNWLQSARSIDLSIQTHHISGARMAGLFARPAFRIDRLGPLVEQRLANGSKINAFSVFSNGAEYRGEYGEGGVGIYFGGMKSRGDLIAAAPMDIIDPLVDYSKSKAIGAMLISHCLNAKLHPIPKWIGCITPPLHDIVKETGSRFAVFDCLLEEGEFIFLVREDTSVLARRPKISPETTVSVLSSEEISLVTKKYMSALARLKAA